MNKIFPVLLDRLSDPSDEVGLIVRCLNVVCWSEVKWSEIEWIEIFLSLVYRWLFWICKSWRRFQLPRQELHEKPHRRFCPQKDTPAVFFIPKIWTNIFMIFFWIWLGSFEWIENCLRKKEALLCGKVLKLCHVDFLKMVYKKCQ